MKNNISIIKTELKKHSKLINLIQDMAEVRKDNTLEELEQEYKTMLADTNYANRDFEGYFWTTKAMCYVLNYKKCGNMEKVKELVCTCED